MGCSMSWRFRTSYSFKACIGHSQQENQALRDLKKAPKPKQVSTAWQVFYLP